MPFLMVLAAWCLIYQMGRLNLEARLQDSPQAVAQASDELDHYRAFLYLSDRFMMSHDPTLETSEWRGQEMLAQLTNTGALSADAFPNNWRLVVNSASNWVSCTPMSEQALGMLSQWIKSPVPQLQGGIDRTQQRDYWVVGQNVSVAEQCF
jgi:hypothetical protein